MKSGLMSAQEECAEAIEYAVPNAVGQLYSALGLLENNVERLHSRLEPVISSERAKDDNGKLRGIHTVPLAEQLCSLVDRIEALNYRTIEVLDRLHV